MAGLHSHGRGLLGWRLAFTSTGVAVEIARNEAHADDLRTRGWRIVTVVEQDQLDRALRALDEAERERDEQATNLVEARDAYKRERDEAREALRRAADHFSNAAGDAHGVGAHSIAQEFSDEADRARRAAGSEEENRV